MDALVLLDRSVDLVSPLPTQLTYEGLLDEMFSINCSSVRLPEGRVSLTDDWSTRLTDSFIPY